MAKIIENKTFEEERSLYALKDALVINSKFEGAIDGESALKESRNITFSNSLMNLRYPFWHAKRITIKDSIFKDNSRASFWYVDDIKVEDTKIESVKAFRESKNIKLNNVDAISDELAWKCKNVEITNSNITSSYILFNSKNIKIDNLTFKGKYSFQYIKDLEIKNSNFDTKDAFWHSNNVIIENSIIKGEYLAWYSNNLTFKNCKIIGTQPFCYAKNLRIIDLELIDCDLSFEYSDVEVINTKFLNSSIKNPLKGIIELNEEVEVIFTNDSLHKTKCKIIKK